MMGLLFQICMRLICGHLHLLSAFDGALFTAKSLRQASSSETVASFVYYFVKSVYLNF